MQVIRAAITGMMLTMILGACIADAKLPPSATVEYFPCTSDEFGGPRVHPEEVLGDSPLWAGFWNTGDQWHIGITHPGGVQWNVTCLQIADPDLVVHETPHTYDALNLWLETLHERFGSQTSPDEFDAGLIVVNGQYVIEIEALSLEVATPLTVGVPFDAWVYGGPVR